MLKFASYCFRFVLHSCIYKVDFSFAWSLTDPLTTLEPKNPSICVSYIVKFVDRWILRL